jgi:hypothetical protein
MDRAPCVWFHAFEENSMKLLRNGIVVMAAMMGGLAVVAAETNVT